MLILSSRWEMCGQVKVVVKIESEDDMLVLQVRIVYISSQLCRTYHVPISYVFS